MMSTAQISGNTYPVREKLKALGGKWDPAAKAWIVPASRAEEARALVAGAKTAPYHGPRKCIACGHVERRNSRGYIEGDRILGSGECQSCYEERKMGY